MVLIYPRNLNIILSDLIVAEASLTASTAFHIVLVVYLVVNHFLCHLCCFPFFKHGPGVPGGYIVIPLGDRRRIGITAS